MPPPAHSLPPPDLSPITLPAPSLSPPLPLLPMPPSTHLPPLPLDPLPIPLRPPLIPPPAQSSPLSDSYPKILPSPWPSPPFPVHTASSLPPPSLTLASPFQALNSLLMLLLVSPARSSHPTQCCVRPVLTMLDLSGDRVAQYVKGDLANVSTQP
ncbi:hypothetical protein EDB83DRAFT_2516516 [Lactarius deliciosus]|nr:hypothetical protein EDB83DRAFT_2516516 [Lactarius deliciosus]